MINVKGENAIKANIITDTTKIKSNLTNYSYATTQYAGIIRIATSEEASAGLLNNVAITPYTLALELNTKQDVISDLSTIRTNAESGNNAYGTIQTYGNIVTHNTSEFATSSQGSLADTALQPNDNISELNNDAGYITSASLPTVNNATLTIQKNGTTIDTFTANASVDKVINITVPTSASDINALPNSTKYGASIDMSLNTTDYKLTISLKDQDGTTLNSKVVDFPIESVVVNGSYDSTNEKIILTLQNGNTIDIPVGDLISGLQTEITSSNKLDADLVDDSSSTNKFVTANDLSLIGTALQPNDNISELTNDMGYITTIKGGTDINVVNSLLPNGYTQLDYIESTGTQYIDTGYKPSNTTKVKTRFSVQEPISFVFGSRNSTSGANQKRFGLHLGNLELGSHWVIQYANTNNAISNYELNIVYDVEMSKSGFYVYGTNIYSLPQTVFTGDYNMYLFANNTADTTTQYGSVKIYSFQIYDNNILIHDYIPCKNSSNVIGMYDIVTNTFFTNAGTGDFVAGLVSATYYILFSNESGYITNSALSGYATETWVGNQGYQTTSNLVTSISSSSTDAQYPSAKCVYDIVGNIESLLHNINSGS